MVEVGYAESGPTLHQEAHWWLDNSKAKSRMVIIIQISKSPKSIHLKLSKGLEENANRGLKAVLRKLRVSSTSM